MLERGWKVGREGGKEELGGEDWKEEDEEEKRHPVV